MRSRLVAAGIAALIIAAFARGTLASSSASACTVSACTYLPIARIELPPTALPPSATSTAIVAPVATSTATPTKTPVATQTPAPTADDPLNTHGQDLYNCGDFATWSQANAVYQANLPGDPNRLDSDDDGIPCESLPGAP